MFDYTLASQVLRENIAKTIQQTLWDDKNVHPVLSLIEKKPAQMQYGASGKVLRVPVNFQLSSTTSHTFSVSNTNAAGSTAGNSSQYANWLITAATFEDVAYFSRQALDNNESGAEMVDFVQREIDNKIKSIRNAIAMELLGGDGLGNVCQITARNTTSITVPLTHVGKFYKGKRLVFAAAATGALRSATALVVTGVARSTGVVSLSGDPTAIAVGATDYVAFEGDRGLALPGFPGWVTATEIAVGGGDSWQGLDRGGQPELYGMVRTDCTGKSTPDAIIDLTAEMANYGQAQACNHALLNPQDFAVAVKQLAATSRVLREVKMGAKGQNGVRYGFEFTGVTVDGAGGPVTLMSCPFVTKGTGFVGDLEDGENCFLAYDGDELVRIDSSGLADGQIFMRDPNSTTVSVRLYSVCAFALNPGKWGRLINVGA